MKIITIDAWKIKRKVIFLSNKWDYLTHVKYFKILLTPVLDFCFPKDMYSKATVTACYAPVAKGQVPGLPNLCKSNE